MRCREKCPVGKSTLKVVITLVVLEMIAATALKVMVAERKMEASVTPQQVPRSRQHVKLVGCLKQRLGCT